MNASDVEIDLADVASAGVYPIHPDDRASLIAAAQQTGLLALDIDLGGCRDKAGLLRRLAQVMKFPAGFGHNWDALADCLRDLDWLPAPGYLLMLRRVEALREAAEEDFETLVDILADCAAEWAERQVPFFAFISLGDDDDGSLDEVSVDELVVDESAVDESVVDEADHAPEPAQTSNGHDRSMHTLVFTLEDEYVELNQLLKLVGLCDSGGAGKLLVASGEVSVDGTQELRKTRKVRAGQTVNLGDTWIRVEAPAG